MYLTFHQSFNLLCDWRNYKPHQTYFSSYFFTPTCNSSLDGIWGVSVHVVIQITTTRVTYEKWQRQIAVEKDQISFVVNACLPGCL